MAHNGVTSIYEDSRGFIWFGTYEGINKYDGYELITFKNTINEHLISSNRVRSLAEDKNGNLWIGTDEGVSIYDYTVEKFDDLLSDKLIHLGFDKAIIRDILIQQDENIIICISQRHGLFVFDQENKKFIGNYVIQNSENQNIDVYLGLESDKSNLLITTSKGLFNFDLRSKKFTRVLENEIGYCNSITKIDNNSYLVTLRNGVAVIEIEKEVVPEIFSTRFITLNNYQFNHALIDTSGNLWLGTLSEGLIHINNVESFLKQKSSAVRKFTDDLPILRSSYIAETSSGSCWLGTFNKGIYRFDIKDKPFHNYNIKMNYENGIESNTVNHIATLDDDRVYVTSFFGGLALFNTKTKKFEALPFQFQKSVVDKITAVYVDSKKNTWLKINGEEGLWRIKDNVKTLEKILDADTVIASDLVIRSFAEDSFGNIWLGTNNGAYRIKLSNTNEIISIEDLNNNPAFAANKIVIARYIYSDPLHNYIWIGSDSNGLYRVAYDSMSQIKDMEVEHFLNTNSQNKLIFSNFVTSILRLPNDDFWIGTEGGGISKLINADSQPKFINYTEKDGLSNNVVKSILYDKNQNLWISTNIGLNEFNTQKNEFRKFNISDGLAFEDFWFSANQIKNGTFLFSGLDGFIYFDPHSISKSEKLPKIRFDNFKVFNKIIKPNDTIHNRILLTKNISDLDKIILKHNENVFSIDVTSLHFSNSKNHNIKYRLEPINNQWIKVPSNQKTISYSGLPPGEYSLSVMASNSLNEWTEPKKIEIVIKPSLWNTNVAYFIYTLFGILLAYTIIIIILKIQALNHKVELEQFEKDKVEELNEAKLRFFANISHEIKTPLTLISRPIDILSERFKGNSEISEKVNLVKRQSKKIQQLIEQVQDFRKADAQALKMNYSRFSFDSFVKDLTVDFKFLADNDDKTLEILKSTQPIIVSADMDKLEKIFNNILNNAFKYTNSNDSIKIAYHQEGDKDLIITVTDTGRGIDEVDIDHIFERFYQSQKKDNAHISGSGIGLAFAKRLVEMHYGFINAQSELGKGTTIKVQLPIIKKHLETDNLNEFHLPKEKEEPFITKLIIENATKEITVSGDFIESTIFYAEDDLEMRNFVSNLLAKYFNVKSFRNGKECLDAMEDEWPDIVISDVQMPEMNGLDLCLKIKSDLKTSHIPVILLTALTNIEDHLQGLRDGADAYIKKPFDVQHLIAKVEALLNTRKQLRERYQVGIPLTKENNKNNRNDNAFLEKLYSLIEENLDNQEFDLNNLARELYLNRTHFYQKVKVLTDHTPFELLKNYRLKKAGDFLLENKFSVNEVYMMTGFKSRTHFTKIFKEKFGVSPSKYEGESSATS